MIISNNKHDVYHNVTTNLGPPPSGAGCCFVVPRCLFVPVWFCSAWICGVFSPAFWGSPTLRPEHRTLALWRDALCDARIKSLTIEIDPLP